MLQQSLVSHTAWVLERSIKKLHLLRAANVPTLLHKPTKKARNWVTGCIWTGTVQHTPAYLHSVLLHVRVGISTMPLLALSALLSHNTLPWWDAHALVSPQSLALCFIPCSLWKWRMLFEIRGIMTFSWEMKKSLSYYTSQNQAFSLCRSRHHAIIHRLIITCLSPLLEKDRMKTRNCTISEVIQTNGNANIVHTKMAFLPCLKVVQCRESRNPFRLW